VCCLEMTTKRKIIGRLVPCRCFRGEEEIVSVLDYSHCGLQQVPKEVFSFERTLEELYLDANQIEELPKVMGLLLSIQVAKSCWGEGLAPGQGTCLPWEEEQVKLLGFFYVYIIILSFFFSLGIQDFPENIKCCKCLTIIEASVNPVSK
ncbi:LRRC7 protein, partial [Rostratula benghalensis]|nr:LRRC7 protein [Rostratula benghalensis]